MAKAKEQREDRDLARAMQGLGLEDHNEPLQIRDNDAMDIDMVHAIEDINERLINLVRSKKKESQYL